MTPVYVVSDALKVIAIVVQCIVRMYSNETLGVDPFVCLVTLTPTGAIPWWSHRTLLRR